MLVWSHPDPARWEKPAGAGGWGDTADTQTGPEISRSESRQAESGEAVVARPQSGHSVIHYKSQWPHSSGVLNISMFELDLIQLWSNQSTWQHFHQNNVVILVLNPQHLAFNKFQILLLKLILDDINSAFNGLTVIFNKVLTILLLRRLFLNLKLLSISTKTINIQGVPKKTGISVQGSF